MKLTILLLFFVTIMQAQTDTICISVDRAANIADSLDLAKVQSELIDTMHQQVQNYEKLSDNLNAQIYEQDLQIWVHKQDSAIQAGRIKTYHDLANENLIIANENYQDGRKYKKRAKGWKNAFWITLGTGIVTSSVIYLTR